MIIICQYRGKSPISLLIKAKTWSSISHSAIARVPDSFPALCPEDRLDVLTHCPIVEAWRGKVQLAHGIETLHTPGTHTSIYAVSRIGFDPAACWDFALAQVGARYDYRGVLGFVSRRDGAQHPDKWFCTEHVFTSVAEGGVELLARIPAHRVNPGMLDISPLMFWLMDLNAPAPRPPRRAGSLSDASQAECAPKCGISPARKMHCIEQSQARDFAAPVHRRAVRAPAGGVAGAFSPDFQPHPAKGASA
jgi:hypothetical protein